MDFPYTKLSFTLFPLDTMIPHISEQAEKVISGEL